MKDKKYTIQEINDEINDAASRVMNSGETGVPGSEDEELNNLVNEVAKARMDSPYYVISQADIDSYMEDRIKNPTQEDRNLLDDYARKYIDNCGGFGEYLSICLDMAFEEAKLTEDEPAEDEPS